MNTRKFCISLLGLAMLTACGGGGGSAAGDAGAGADGSADSGPPEVLDLLCGNHVTDEGEACDNGPTEGDGCDRFCGVETCGDGVWHGGEECDDANTVPHDGCSADCRIEPDYVCESAPRLATGADGAGAARPVGQPDLTWSWSEAPDGERHLTTLLDNCAPGEWPDAPEGARWIGRGACDQDAPPDATTWYHATFMLPSALAVQHTRIALEVRGADGIADLLVNGESTGLTRPAGEVLDLTALDGALLGGGINTLSVGVRNGAKGEGPNPDGLLVVATRVFDAGSRCASNGACGNGFLDEGEVCDDGNIDDGDGCAANCSATEACGDEKVDPGEDCDDGNVLGGDGCSQLCHTESCGDGRLAWNEGCDDANTEGGDGCAADCTIDAGMECLNPHPIASGSDGRGGTAHVDRNDLVWTWSKAADGEFAPAVVSENCDPEIGGWASPTPEAEWVTREGCHAAVPDDARTWYRASFHIPTAAAAGQTRLAGRLWADTDIVQVLVNDVAVPINHLVVGDFTGGGHALSDIPSSAFREGENTLTVVVHNAPEAWGHNPGGLMVSVPEAYGTGSFCGPPIACGDGEVDAGEVCDDGNREDADGCSSDCLSDEVCGNGIHDPGEACDDGNHDAGDGCAPNCQSREECGDYVTDVAAGEVCDDGNFESGDGCSETCRSDETCGNGIVDFFEECDEGDTLDGDGCSSVCVFEQRCGNGRRGLGEACDDGNQEGGDGCSADCASDESCGNGAVDGITGEECDDANEEDGDGCSNFCRIERCGDGVLEGAEDCDDANLEGGDGCSADCEVEPGFNCVSAPNLNTGSDGDGGRRPVGSADLIWSWSETPDGERTSATVSGNCAPGGWVDAGAGSEWINRSGCGTDSPHDADTYYQASFTIPTIRQARETVLDGSVWADNFISDVLVNGVSTGFHTMGEIGFAAEGIYFGDWSSELYQRGVNTLTVVVHNAVGLEGQNPDGLLVHLPNAFGLASVCLPE